MTIEYRKMSLFDAEPGAILVHACNAQGVWGSGIAKEFKERYPYSFKYYEEHCKDNSWYGPALGTGFINPKHNDESHFVGCIITSENYGSKKDSKAQILANTTLAINNLLRQARLNNDSVIYSNKFNSGLFEVPWEETEIVLKEVLKHYPNITWVVCDQNME